MTMEEGSERYNVYGFEHGVRAQAKEGRQPPEPEKINVFVF